MKKVDYGHSVLDLNWEERAPFGWYSPSKKYSDPQIIYKAENDIGKIWT